MHSLDIEWIEIPAGPFKMGLSEEQALKLFGKSSWHGETPQREIYLPRFFISRYPVTCGQYVEFAEAAHPDWDITFQSEPELEKHPVFESYHTAIDFCEWIEARLPTSEEWEKAARGTDGRLFPWGNWWDTNLGNFGQWERRNRTGGVKTVPVDSYPDGASPYGVMDMMGNCYEWTTTPGRSGRYETYIIRGSDTDPTALTPRAHRVTGFISGGVSPMSYPPNTGFRVVRDTPPDDAK